MMGARPGQPPSQPAPVVSVVMANRNGGRFLGDAIRSVLRQDLAAIELILVDDGSQDDSLAIASAMAAGDARLRILPLPRAGGPAAARNRALDMARGAWIAVVDSDDLLHPQRLSRLLAAAERDGADIVADDMLAFEQNAASARALFAGSLRDGAVWIGAEEFVRANRIFSRDMPLGYLKPLIRAERVRDLRYDEALTIAEDYDFVLRLMLRGARFRLVPELTYFYRRHSASISHRLSAEALSAMVAGDARLRSWAGAALTPGISRALDERLASIDRAQAFVDLAARLKGRDLRGTLALAAARPGVAATLLRVVARDRLARLGQGRGGAEPPDDRPSVCVLSRQRVVEGTNGSSTYLLGICRALREQGFAVHLLCPSPAVLGRVPVLRVRRERKVFDSIAIRRTIQIGDWVLARDPALYLRAALGIAHRMASRIGVHALAPFARPAPYAVAVPWTVEDLAYVAAHARTKADAILADYAFLTPGIPYALRPGSPSAVVMHDLFSSRAAGFMRIGGSDSVAQLDTKEEAELLAGADAVLAIQAEEAAKVRAMVPADRRVVVTPMAVEPARAAQPGQPGVVLFLGSGTAPNVDAIRWFIDEVWPRIRQANPEARLQVAGTVCNALFGTGTAQDVQLLGRVEDLGPLYEEAAVVISPLRVGSGLKIKLVEAMAHGKAIVATPVTLQGVVAEATGSVLEAEEAEPFAAAVLQLLHDRELRDRLGEAALKAVRQHFSPAAVHAPVAALLRGEALPAWTDRQAAE